MKKWMWKIWPWTARKHFAAIQASHDEKERRLKSALNWIRVTHGLDNVPMSNEVKDVLKPSTGEDHDAAPTGL